ncbi:3-isopropylmalate dehydrogenase [Parapedobacter koreensis]|uniref:3-isopropylmalate dehydrogenase n=1 Tax=Parapedobacter koreensis TaxID=332977 RepID=A0A1H7TDZ5_9SPHI|nr:3-isopropylmalate dehydrogenase [Parapedobacter koreensis]SEL82953.1 3-isopropylmalate dehydrogenase [Parapedobacter koreensis]
MQKNILIIPGDGIGPEVTACGKAVLEEVAARYGYAFAFEEAQMGHEAILATGVALPDETFEKAKASDAILFGAVGHVRYDNDPTLKVRPEQGLFRMRKELGLYANIRPVILFDELLDASSLKPEIVKGTDILFFRELTGGAYFGEKVRSEDGEMASDLMVYHRYEVERIAVKAFEAARTRRKKVCSVDKANVLESSRLWREVVQQVARRYPDVETTHMLADNTAMQLIKHPTWFDVIVTENLFGDILTDETAQVVGSMGMLASASIGDGTGFFEPIHGSAYDIAGQDKANPLASILSAALLLEIGFGMKEAAKQVNDAVARVLKAGYRTSDISGRMGHKDKIVGTREMGALVIQSLREQLL